MSRRGYLSVFSILALTLSGAAWAAPAVGPTKAAAKAAMAKTAKAAQKSGMGSKIGVSGHWTITVKNPDGSVAAKTEFDNAYAPSKALSYILAQTHTVVFMSLRYHSVFDINQSPCTNLAGAPWFCTITQNHNPNLELEPPGISRTTGGLLVTSGEAFDDYDLKIRGSNTVQRDGLIDTVTSQVGLHEIGAAVDDHTDYSLTTHTLAQPIPVIEGQQVQLDVTISFGPGQ